ncbi:MAG: hypothetical protein H6659_10015 [Ardenticatenaceae bacterium]|nr:hypothetical protein [Ardenticatenaceae bacterium]MCB8986468.1 hypothetical protein [Ardenticatenaceae bacterium]
MTQRILTLSRYFLRSLLFSLAGLIYILIGFAYWLVMFPPDQHTPEASYYILVLAAFGAGLTFLATLTIASRANQAGHAAWIVRLPSRVEYLTAVLLSSILFATTLQLLLALLALFRGPDLSFSQVLFIPPIWLALNTLTAVLALHATDFVAAGWSRVYLFGLIALFLFGQSLNDKNSLNTWIILRINDLSRSLAGAGWIVVVTPLNNLARWLQQDGPGALGNFFSLPFWPFHAIANAVIGGSFDTSQALAPAVLLLYATLLIMLAADIFANKDLDLTE